MASIVEKSSDKRLVLTDEYAARTLSVGSDWGKLRLGLRFRVDMNTSTTDLTIPSFFFGLSNGNTNVPGSGDVDHALGIYAISGSFNTNATDYVSGPHVNIDGGRLVNNSYTLIAASGSGNFAFYNANAAAASYFIMEITKGTPDFTIEAWYLFAGTTETNFIAMMQTGSTGTRFINATTAIDEATNGDLDTVALSWGHATVPLEVSDIGISVIG